MNLTMGSDVIVGHDAESAGENAGPGLESTELTELRTCSRQRLGREAGFQ